jgi:hypothetical protein
MVAFHPDRRVDGTRKRVRAQEKKFVNVLNLSNNDETIDLALWRAKIVKSQIGPHHYRSMPLSMSDGFTFHRGRFGISFTTNGVGRLQALSRQLRRKAVG